MQNIIGNSHEHTALLILLYTSSDRDFLSALQTSQQMRNIASQQRIWKERLELYYPDYLEFRIQTGLNWKQFYPIAPLMSRMFLLEDECWDWKEGKELCQKLADHIVKCDLDYNLIVQKIDARAGFLTRDLISALFNTHMKPYADSEKIFMRMLNIIKSDRNKIKEIFWYIMNDSQMHLSCVYNKFINGFTDIYFSTFSEPYDNVEIDMLMLTGTHLKFLTPTILTEKIIDYICRPSHRILSCWKIILYMITHKIRPIFRKFLLTEEAMGYQPVAVQDFCVDTSQKKYGTVFLDVIQEFSNGGIHLTQEEVDSVHLTVAANSPIYMQTLRDCCK